MRTIILNTLGDEFSPDSLFFLPFREDDLSWIRTGFERMKECPEEIARLLRSQMTRENYHLVFLADLNTFSGTAYENMRQACRAMLSAWLYHTVLLPLANMSLDLPAAVTEIYLYERTIPGTRGIPEDELYSELLRLEQLNGRSEGIYATYHQDGKEFSFDITDMAGGAWAAFLGSFEETDRKETPKNQELYLGSSLFPNLPEVMQEQRVLEQRDRQAKESAHLCDSIRKRIEEMQYYVLPMAGEQKDFTPEVRRFQFAVDDDNLELSMIDLQIQISQLADAMYRYQGNGDFPEVEIRPHSSQEMNDIIRRAELRLQYLSEHMPGLRYYPLKADVAAINPSESENEMRTAIEKDHAELLGILTSLSNEDIDQDWQLSLGEHLKKSFFRIDTEKKQFLRLFSKFKAQYDEESVKKEQDDILSICFKVFRDWRTRVLERHGKRIPYGLRDTETEMPDAEALRKQIHTELNENQEQYTRIAADHLEDYQDVREEALGIRAEFEGKSRFWTPDAKVRNLPNFGIFSILMGIVFIAVMIVPYVLIESGVVGFEVSKTVVFLVSLAVFSVLYLLGFLLWIHGLCKELHGLTQKLYKLMSKSAKRRAESVKEQITLYSELLPKSIVLSEELAIYETIDQENRQKCENLKRHEMLIGRSLEDLQRLRTSVRIPEAQGKLQDKETERLELITDLAPYEGPNRAIYFFFTE